MGHAKIILSLGVAACSVCALAAPASAQYPEPRRISIDPPPGLGPSQAPMVVPAAEGRGLSIGFGIGYGMPFGKVATDMGDGASDVSRAVVGAVPLSLSAGMRFIAQLHVGMYFSYAPGIGADAPDSACPRDRGASCSGSSARVGAELQYHVLPLGLIDPWLGVGTGYEFFWVTPGTSQRTFQGWEIANLQAGADVRIRGGLRIGPFITFAIGRYDYIVNATDPGGSVTGHLANPALHQWLMLGVRLQYTAFRPLD